MSLTETLQSSMAWYLVLSAVGLAAYPWVFVTCQGLYDRGASLFRSTGLAAIALPFWVLGNLIGVPFNSGLLLIVAVLLAVPGWWLAVRRWSFLLFVRKKWCYIATLEVATALLFFGYVLFRGYNPDIHGTEKPMELAFLNAAMHSGEIPVPDPWFSGEPINYYYFGYVALAGIALLSGATGEVAFNLGLATAFSLATVAAGGLAANLAVAMHGFHQLRVALAGLLGGFLLSFGANLHAAIEFLRRPPETVERGWWDGVGWASSRVIEDTGFPGGGSRTVITEFPAFSWILGDLHPHVIAYPWLIVALALVANLVLIAHDDRTASGLVGAGISIGISLAVLYASNTWDVPIVAAIFVGSLLLLLTRVRWRFLAVTGASAIGTFLLISLPFMSTYDSPTGQAPGSPGGTIPLLSPLTNTIGYVYWDRTSTLELLTHWGGLLTLLALALAALFAVTRPGLDGSPLLLVGCLITVALAALILSAPAVLFFGMPAILCVLVVRRRHDSLAISCVAMMVLIALIALIATEFFFVRDPFGDRMNTVFKVSFQVWAVICIALGALIPSLVAQLRERWQWMRAGPFCIVLGVVLVAMSMYTPISAYRWGEDMNNWRGIDGLHYIDRVQPDERRAFQWLSEHRDSVEVVLEAPGCAYGSDNFMPHSRVSMATGIPTVVGWDGHQRQWRRGQPDHLAGINPRIEHVRLIYEGAEEYRDVVEQYGVTHVFVGAHELEGYRQCGHGPPYDIAEPGDLERPGWELEFSDGNVRIFRLLHGDSEN